MRDVMWNLVVGLLLFSETTIYVGVLSIKKKIFMAYGSVKFSENMSVLYGWVLIIVGILFFLAAIGFAISILFVK